MLSSSYSTVTFLPKYFLTGNKSAASTAPCPATAFTSSKYHKSVKNKMRYTCYVPLRFCKASRKSVKDLKLYKGHTYMTWITTDNVQRAKTLKADVRVTVLVFCQLYYGDIHLHKVSRKYLQQFSSYRVDTTILQKSQCSKFKGA